MSLPKLRLFIVLVTIVALAPAGRFNRQIEELDAPKPKTVLHTDGPPCGSERRTEKPGGSYWARTFRVESEMPPSFFLPVQSKNANDLAAGKLLVASRNLGDPNFTKTVVLLVHYDAKGVVGLILNRRTDIPLSRVLEDLKAAKDRSDPVYLGGPVEIPQVSALFQSPAKVEGAEHVLGGIYLISAKTLFEQTLAAQPGPGIFHVYLGYAGWTMDQLRNEVALGAWFIFPADASSVFNPDPDSLWLQMIRRTELQLAESKPADAVHGRTLVSLSR